MEPKLLTAHRFVDMRTGISYRYVYSETEYFRPHYHEYCEVFLVLSGRARHLLRKQEYELQPRQLVFVRPSDVHDYASEGSGYSMLNITFTLETLQGLLNFLGEGFPGHALISAAEPPQVMLSQQEFESINARMAAVQTMDAEDLPALKTALRVLLLEIFGQHFSKFAAKPNTAPQWLEFACNQMERNGSFAEGSEALFALASRSREHVCRSMKKHKGMTVSEFVNDLRLRYIANMLRFSNHTVAQIVFSSGFNNLSWAACLFRKKYGMTMQTYRKNS